MTPDMDKYYLSMCAGELRQWLILEVDSNVAMWAPGVSELGWSFHVEDNHVFVNSGLSEAYKARFKRGLPHLLPGVKLSFTNDPSLRQPDRS